VVLLGIERDESVTIASHASALRARTRIAADFTLEHVSAGLAVHQLGAIHPLVVNRFRRFENARVEYTQVTAEADDHQLRVERSDGACSHRVSGVHQTSSQFAEAIDIDCLVAPAARTVAALDTQLVIVGLCRYLRVFDPGISNRRNRLTTRRMDRTEL